MHQLYTIFRIIIVLLILLITLDLSAQWERQTPLPFPPFTGEGVDFSTSNRGYIVGDPADGSSTTAGRVLETTDGGVTWHELQLNNTNDNINNVFFYDNNYGWMVGNIGYKTTDGGTTWTQMSNLPAGSHYHVRFITQDFGWTVSNGGLCTTHDGGNTWDYHGYNNGDLNAGSFLDADNGLAWTDYDLKITDDGGSSWTTVFSAFDMPVAHVINANEAFMIAGNKLYYSNDGWQTWQLTFTGSWPTWASMKSIMLNSTNIIIYNTQGDAYYSSEGGMSWNATSVPGGGYSHLKIDASTALIFGIGGSVYKTSDAGLTWTTTLNGSGLPIWASTIRTAGEIWAVGNDGVIMQSLDNGDSWDYYSSGIAGIFNDIKFFDDYTGIAGGINGKTMRTTDGGLNWDPKLVGADIQSIHILDAQNVFVCGGNTVAKSSDKGINWSFMTNPAGSNVTHSDLFFVSQNEGWLVSEYWYGAIWHTTDGGNSWTQVYYDQGHPFKAIHMHDANLGYAVGPGDGIFKTTDGWQSYQWLPFASNAPGLIYDIEFIGTDTMWIAGEHGYIAKSLDGGQSWTVQTFPGGGFNNDVEDIDIVSFIEAYAVTDEGDFLQTLDGGNSWTVSNISGPVINQWEALALTNNGTWVSGREVWFNGNITAPLLPVELISFTSNCRSGNAELQWVSAYEENFDYYQIEYSVDGMYWQSLEKVYSNQRGPLTRYAYTDNRKNKSAQAYYRLKMVDIDGSFSYSDIVRAYCSGRENDVKVFPNPASPGQIVNVLNSEEMNGWHLMDAFGQSVMSGQSEALNTSNLQSGIYYLQIKQDEASKLEKLVIQD